MSQQKGNDPAALPVKISLAAPTSGRNNFSWSVLDLSGQSLNLYDPNEMNGALYLRVILGAQLDGDQITNISSSDGLNLY